MSKIRLLLLSSLGLARTLLFSSTPTKMSRKWLLTPLTRANLGTQVSQNIIYRRSRVGPALPSMSVLQALTSRAVPQEIACCTIIQRRPPNTPCLRSCPSQSPASNNSSTLFKVRQPPFLSRQQLPHLSESPYMSRITSL